MGIKSYIFILLSFALCSAKVFGQIDETVYTIGEEKFYIHTVEQGNTIYGISKKYSIEISDIMDANPGIENGLGVGQKVKIPIKKVSQQAIRVVPPRVENDFIYHTVAQGETMYFLSKRYQVEIEDIQSLNPETSSGLRVGQVLKIAIKQARPEQAVAKDVAGTERYMVHEVEEKETLYSISRKYYVSIDSIKIVNPGLNQELSIGQLIRIPKERTPTIIITESAPEQLVGQIFVDKEVIKNRYNVCLMLPLFLDENDTLEVKRKPHDAVTFFGPSVYALEFMHGVLMALEEVRQKGLSVNLHVFDTKNDASIVSNLLRQPIMKDMHLFIGPFNHNNVAQVADFAIAQGVHVVCAVDQSNKVLLSHPNVSKVESSNITQVEKLAAFVAEKHHQDNVVMIDSKEMRDDLLERLFLENYRKAVRQYPRRSADSARVAMMEVHTVNDLIKKLDQKRLNVLVMPSGDKSAVTDFMTRIHGLQKRSYLITVFGIEKWLDFDNIDIAYKHDVNLHVTSGHYVDFESKATKKFLSSYRALYATDPGRYGMLGYDIGSYYFAGLFQYGTNFPNHLNSIEHTGVHLGFDHQQTGVESGFENRSVYILRYGDYKILQAD